MPTAVGTEQLAASSSPSQESVCFTPGFGFMFKSCTEPAMENDTDGWEETFSKGTHVKRDKKEILPVWLK